MKKFLIQYKMPLAGLDAWIAKPESERKPEEERLMKEWQKWREENKSRILVNNAAGKTKKVTVNGVEDFRNEIMVYGVVEAENLEEAGKLFLNNPHLQIPEAWIEVTEVREM